MKIAVYPGSFDPITNGHLEILKRALNIFDHVIMLVAVNPDKKTRFSPEDRVAMIKEAVDDERVSVDSYDGLTVEYSIFGRKACFFIRINSDKHNDTIKNIKGSFKYF